MIKIEVNEEELNEIFKEKILQYIKSHIKDRDIEYWVRVQVDKLIAKELVDGVIKEKFPKERIEEIMKAAFEKYVCERFHND